MTNPQDFRGFNGVLNTGMVLVTCGYIAVGFFGYLKYGDAVHGSITLNLPPSDKYVVVFHLISLVLEILVPFQTFRYE